MTAQKMKSTVVPFGRPLSRPAAPGDSSKFQAPPHRGPSGSNAANTDADRLLDQLGALLSQETPVQTALVLARNLQSITGAQQVAIGLRRTPRSRMKPEDVQLAAVLGPIGSMVTMGQRRALCAALFESMNQKTVVMVPTLPGSRVGLHVNVAHRAVAALFDQLIVVGVPLAIRGECFGAVLLLGNDLPAPHLQRAEKLVAYAAPIFRLFETRDRRPRSLWLPGFLKASDA